MPLALLLALAASVGVHMAALLGPDFAPFGAGADEPAPLRAELQAPPPAAESPPPKAMPKEHPKKHRPRAKPAHPAAAPEQSVLAVNKDATSVPVEANPVSAAGDSDPAVQSAAAAAESSSSASSSATSAEAAPGTPVTPRLPARGAIRYAISKGTQGFVIGRAEQRWEFDADGRYRLRGTMETTGLVWLFKSFRFENESSGYLLAGGLRPERYTARRDGRDANESADFDWPGGRVLLARDGQFREIVPGTQDILSLNYQLAYLPRPESGAAIGVVTGKKYERYALDALGEETVDTPAGRFRTLHLRAATDSVTEIWLALDRDRLPVKIRFTDKKGDVFEQVATEIGTPAAGQATPTPAELPAARQEPVVSWDKPSATP